MLYDMFEVKKYKKYMLDDGGKLLKLKDDAPESVKKEIKALDKLYYECNGVHLYEV